MVGLLSLHCCLLNLTENCQFCASVSSPVPRSEAPPSLLASFQTIHPTWTLDALSFLNLYLGKVACHLNLKTCFCFLVEKALSWWKWVIGLNAQATFFKELLSLNQTVSEWLCDRNGVSFEFLMMGRMIDIKLVCVFFHRSYFFSFLPSIVPCSRWDHLNTGEMVHRINFTVILLPHLGFLSLTVEHKLMLIKLTSLFSCA